MKIINFLISLIFPKECFVCQREGRWFCKECLPKLMIHDNETCPLCGCFSGGGLVCYTCSKESDLKGVFSLFDYNDQVVSLAIKKFKYNFAKDVGESLGEILAEKVNDFLTLENNRLMGSRWPIKKESTVVLAVPLSKKRLNWRGFNQSEILAKSLAEKLNLTFNQVLIKTKETKAQAKLLSSERKINLQGAFSLINKQQLAGWTVILIDDVLTTGATLNENARILKEAGVKKIYGITLAKG